MYLGLKFRRLAKLPSRGPLFAATPKPFALDPKSEALNPIATPKGIELGLRINSAEVRYLNEGCVVSMRFRV